MAKTKNEKYWEHLKQFEQKVERIMEIIKKQRKKKMTKIRDEKASEKVRKERERFEKRNLRFERVRARLDKKRKFKQNEL